MRTLTAASVGEIVNALAEGYSVQEVAATYGVSRNSINEIRIGRAWGHLPRPPQLPQPYRKPVEARACIVCGVGIAADRIRSSPTVMTCNPQHSQRHRAALQQRASRRRGRGRSRRRRTLAPPPPVR